jgi:hypothetical protein
MSSLNNWDLKAINNAVYDLDGDWCCLVSDLGTSLGKTGNYFTRSKSVLKDYPGSHFIENATPQDADVVMHSRPFFLSVFTPRGYRERARRELITRHIPRAEANRPGKRGSQLSEEQIRDRFRSAGYAPAEVEGYKRTVQTRIEELKALCCSPPETPGPGDSQHFGGPSRGRDVSCTGYAKGGRSRG